MAKDKLEGRFEEDEAKDYERGIKLSLFDVVSALDKGVFNITFTNNNGEPIYTINVTQEGQGILAIEMEDGTKFRIEIKEE